MSMSVERKRALLRSISYVILKVLQRRFSFPVEVAWYYVDWGISQLTDQEVQEIWEAIDKAYQRAHRSGKATKK